MAAYIVALVVGAVSLLFPLVYSMHADACRATIWAQNPNLTTMPFTPYCPTSVLYGTSVIGALVLLLSAAMIAKTGLHQLKAQAGEQAPLAPVMPQGQQSSSDAC